MPWADFRSAHIFRLKSPELNRRSGYADLIILEGGENQVALDAIIPRVKRLVGG